MTGTDPRILLFDLYHGGHHFQYLSYLLDHWIAHRPAGRLEIVISEAAARAETAFMERARPAVGLGVGVHPVATRFDMRNPGPLGLVRSDREHARHLREAVRALDPHHCLLMYLDQAQLSLATDLRFESNTAISGIYFRPTFHYAAFSPGHRGLRQRITDLRKKAMLAAAMRNPHFRFLFALDPFVLEYLPRRAPRVEGVWLPDPVAPYPDPTPPDAFRREIGVQDGRRLVSLFGVIDQRKGIGDLVSAARRLAPERQRRMSLAVFGPVDRTDPSVGADLDTLARETRIQLIVQDRYVGHAETQSLLGASDLILLPYRRHVGSSNVLVRAAQSARPVLGSDFGVLGRQIRENDLGATVDCGDPELFAATLGAFLDEPATIPFDARSARDFAEANSNTQFCETIYSRLLPGPTQHTGT